MSCEGTSASSATGVFEVLRLPGLAALWIVVALAIVSGIDYFASFWREVYRPGPRAVPNPQSPEPLRKVAK
jgi:hypothetical protein